MNIHAKPSKLKDDELIQQLRRSESAIADMTSDLVQNSLNLSCCQVQEVLGDLARLKGRYLSLVEESVERSLITVVVKRGRKKVLYRL